MFYSKFMFVKKGPLAKVWLAAHFHRKLNKQMVQGTDINLSCKSILEPQAPLALRLSGQLLLGLVRIYQKKVKYLQEDCSDALTKMKSVFRAGAVDLPPDSATAASGAITHPDNYDEIEYAIPDIPMENFDEMMADVIAEGRAASSLGATRLDDYSASQRAITLDEVQDEPFMDDVLGGRDEELIPFEEEESKVSDVEVPRGSQDVAEYAVRTPGERPDDLSSEAEKASPRSSRRSVLPQDNMSAFDTTDVDQESIEKASVANDNDNVLGYEIDAPNTPTTPMPPPASPISPTASLPIVEVVEEEKKVKPKRKLRRDTKTELPSAFMSAALKDASDIRLVDGRPTIPFTKRAKLRDVAQKSNLSQLLKQPSAFSAVSAGTIHAESELNIAPELWGIIEQAHEFERPDEEELPSSQARLDDLQQEVVEEKAQEEEEEKVQEEELVQEDRNNDFEVPDLGSLIDESTVGGEPSIGAPTPGSKAMEEEDEDRERDREKDREGDREAEAPERPERPARPERPYRDDPEHFRQELTEFFGEDRPKKKGKKGETTEGEELVALGWGQRTDKMHQVLVNEMKGKTSVDFDDLIGGRSRHLAAGVFYQLLVLKSHSIIQVSQKAPYDNIVISALKRTARAS